MPSYIFMDESGDLGFDFSKRKTTKYFVITCLFVKDRKPIAKIIKKILAGFGKGALRRHGGVLHSFKESKGTRLKLLSLLNDKDVSVLSIYLNKAKVYTRLRDEQHVLYNYVTNILLDRIYTKRLLPTDQAIELVASKRETNKFLNRNFCNYLTSQVAYNHKVPISIRIATPYEDKCLQVADHVCWALFRKWEHGDLSYAEVIKGKIIEESPLFP